MNGQRQSVFVGLFHSNVPISDQELNAEFKKVTLAGVTVIAAEKIK